MTIFIKNILFTFLLFVFSTQVVLSQSRKSLEKKRKQTQREIAYTNQLLKQNKNKSKKSFNQLLILNKKITSRRSLISTIKEEITLLNNKINENQEIIESLSFDLELLKKEYAKMIYYSYKMRNPYDKMIFVLASQDFNQAYKRLKYLQQYTEYRQKQAEAILSVAKIMQIKTLALEEIKNEKTSLLKNQRTETVALSVEKSEQNKILTNLKAQQKDLLAKLRKQERAAIKLRKKIESIIAEEARKARENKKATSTKTGYALTPEEKIISDNFGANKGRLPWPTKRGIITGKYGKHEHPILKGIIVMNNGVDISTQKGAKARSVFKGKVTRIIKLSGVNNAVMIRHGDYFTVYTNLKSVYVTAGQTIEAKTELGLIYTDIEDGNKTILQLQIWKGNAKQNPAYWLSKKR